MTTVYLVRHAEAEGNLYRRIHGSYDALITDNGFRQIAALEQRFQSIRVDAVWSSDLYRTMTTARAVYVPKGLELHTDPELRELAMGDWEDQPWGHARHYESEELDRFNQSDPTWRAPNGENLMEVGKRMERAVRRIASQYPDQTVAIFSHGTAIRQVVANLRGIKPEHWHKLRHSDNTAVTKLLVIGDVITVAYEGDGSHLDESISTLARQSWWRVGGTFAPDVNLWYRPIHWDTEKNLYLEARQEAWTSTHVDGPAFEPEEFLRNAEAHLERSPWGVSVAMKQDEVAGILELDTQRYQEENAGYIPFFYLMPHARQKNLGVQLLGHAVSFFRPLGRDKLRLRCAPYNTHAQHFYQKYGFTKIGEELGSRVPLDILEKYIGYNR